MQIKLDKKPEEVWLAHLKAYKRGELDVEPFVFVKAGAQAAGLVLIDIYDSVESRRKRFDRVSSEVRCIINDIERKMRRPAHAEWLRGYLCYRIQDFQGGRRHYYCDSTREFHEIPDFLADLGRFEYNAGRVMLATEIFEKLFPVRTKLSAQPLQAYRWLAKVYRHTRNFNKEMAILGELKLAVLDLKTDSFPITGGHQREDISISRKFVIEHYGQSLLNAGHPDEALSFIKEWIQSKDGDQVALACQGIFALLALGKEEEAGCWAEEWAVSLDDPKPLSEYFSRSRRPFSAMKMKEKFLTLLSEKKATENHRIMFLSDGNDFHESCSGDVMKLYKEAQRCFNQGFYQEGVEAVFQFTEALFEKGGAPTLLACCMAFINDYISFIPRTRKLDALFAEARDRYQETVTIVSQYGRFLLLCGKPEEAMVQFKEADALGAGKDPLFPVLMGKAAAELGEEIQARRYFEKALKSSSGADLALAYLYASEWASGSGLHFDVLRWYSCYQKDFLQAKGFPDGDLGAVNSPRNQYIQKIFRLAGQAAFALQDYAKAVECFENLLANHGGLLFFATRNSDSHVSYRFFSEASLLLALAYCLAGDLEKTSEMFSQAREIDPENPLLPAIEALRLASDGKISESVSYVLTAPLEEWLFSLVGGYILEKSASSGSSELELKSLRSRVGLIRGDVPSHAELFSRYENQSQKLAEVEESANNLQQTFNSFKQAMRSIVDSVPLPEEVISVRQNAIENGKNIEEYVDLCVKHLVKQYSKTNVSKSRYTENFPEGVWRKLDNRVQERIVAADRYVVAITENTYDFGPAFLALASALEILLKEKLIKPLSVDIRKTFANPDVELSADLKSGSLGTIPYLLAQRGHYSTRYKSFLQQWLESAFPAHARYMLDNLPDRVSKIASLRNSWAHGGEGVRYERFQEMEQLLFDKNDGVFMRLANVR